MTSPFGLTEDTGDGEFDVPDPDKAEIAASPSSASDHIGTRFQGLKKKRVRKVLRPTSFLSSQKNSKFLRVSEKIETVAKNVPEEDHDEYLRRKARERLANLPDVSPEVRRLFTQNLRSHTEAIRDFLVTEIAPFEVAMEAALEEASEAIELVTGTKNAKIEFSRPRRVADRMSELRTIDFLCRQFNVPEELRKIILEQFTSKEGTDEKLSFLRALSGLHKAQ